MITLAYNAISLALDPDLLWSDEHSWSPVEQAVDTSITGALIIQADGDASRPGRPITLQPEGDDSAWMSLADLEQLKAWAAVPGAVFTLTLRGVVRSVMFRHHDKPALEAKAVTHFSDPAGTDPYLLTLKFMEI
jgi:hypothetical protein